MILKCTTLKKEKSLVILLVLLLVLLSTPNLAAQELDTQDEGPRVIIQGLPENPIAGSIWTLTFLVAYSDPNEVEVIAPQFTGPFVLEQVSKGPRYINETEIGTVVEYRFKASRPGIFYFDAFTVISPDTQEKTDPFEVTILQSPTASQATTTKQIYQFVWEGAPSSIAIGESAVFNLRISGSNATSQQMAALIPEAGLFVPHVPPGHIVESLRLGPEERSAGVALKLHLVPLNVVPFIMEGRQLASNAVNNKDASYEIPSLRITVNQMQVSSPGLAETNEIAQKKNNVVPFPSLQTAITEYHNIYKKYTIECDAIYANAKNIWESASFAEALATLRKNERDHPAGKLLTVIRSNAEKALDFYDMHDERRDLLMKLWLFTGRYRCGVLMETTIRRIPDQAGEEIAHFREGQPVLVLQGSKNIKWLQIITVDNNKTSGWIPEDKIILY